MATAYRSPRRLRTRPLTPFWALPRNLTIVACLAFTCAVPIAIAFYLVTHVDQTWGDEEWSHAGEVTAVIPLAGDFMDGERFQVRTASGSWNVVGSMDHAEPNMEVRLSKDGRIRIGGRAYHLLHW
jgi:hypothetical protein